jgi:hypothetical protein
MHRIRERRALERLRRSLDYSAETLPHAGPHAHWVAAILGERHEYVAQKLDIDECELCGRTRASLFHARRPGHDRTTA